MANQSAFCSTIAGVVVSAIWLMVPIAHAATLTNLDSTPYTVEIVSPPKTAAKAAPARSATQAAAGADGGTKRHELAPGKSIAGLCPDGCIIRLNGSDKNDYTLEGTERVSIEGGLVYYDGEETKPKDDDNPAN